MQNSMATSGLPLWLNMHGATAHHDPCHKEAFWRTCFFVQGVLIPPGFCCSTPTILDHSIKGIFPIRQGYWNVLHVVPKTKLHIIECALMYWTINATGRRFCHFLSLYLEFLTSFRLFSISSTTNGSKLSNVLFVFLQKIRLKKYSIEVLSKGHQLPFSYCFPEPSFQFSVDFIDSVSIFKVQKWPLSFTVCVNMLNSKFLSMCGHVTYISCSLDFCP